MNIKLQQWCCFLTLQLGVLHCAITFIVISISIVVVNAVSEDDIQHMGSSKLGVMLFAGVIMLIWIVAFLGGLMENAPLLSVALFFWSWYVLVWMILVIMSNFARSLGNNLCIEGRCTVTLWLLSVPYQRSMESDLDYYYHNPHEPPLNLPAEDRFAGYADAEASTPSVQAWSGSRQEMRESRKLFAFVVYGLAASLSSVLMVSSWLLLYSYYKELTCYLANFTCKDICEDDVAAGPTPKALQSYRRYEV